ncbi:protein PAT1 homolog 1-like [Toxorhynchites rutilus septentrionalis]|uniref:protein PAT1 homolog 1-like n=1 Tax=Toxorhynchites rutilus septentrionalis TaxID=329112 RepID=UPI00247931BE|nr:protein PAT1 homolog 1-like [Toxorhynchites rutilus septentrionalis]
MTDAFFGFDATLPVEDDGGGGIGGARHEDDSEEEYDALNEETFGQAREGDWEGMHENLVRLDQREGGDGDSGADSDLDFNFSSVRIDNLELNDDNESEARLQLDPSVWTMPSKPETPRPQPPQAAQRMAGPGTSFGGLPNFAMSNPGQMRMCSVEEIEQNMLKQQVQVQNHHPLPPLHPPRQQDGLQQQYLQNITRPRPPPGFPTPPGMNQPPPGLNQLPIPVNFPPPMNMIPPPLHLLQTNIPPPGNGLQPPMFPLNVPPPNFHEQNHANFNQRLVKEIQQNHPMLNQHRQHHQQNRYQHNNRQNYHQQHNRYQNGKLNRYGEFDEYANLMSERNKQWLLGIQLSQLNKDTPYYNDYYFCVFRDRKERQKGNSERESKAHKDNTFYHPFTQQMLQRNGLIGRERRNSEKSQDIKEVPARNYTPLQFENSLGKLQCGSVTAPRKIIDQDVVADTSANCGAAVNSEVLSQRKSRQILLHIESLYMVLLKLEDLNNPLAIEAKQLLKEKRERERLMALERGQSVDELNNLTATGTELAHEPEETFEALLEKLTHGLTPDGVLLVLSARKGKLLLTRIQAVLKDHPLRWNLWCTILSSLVLLPKRERDDPEHLLSPLFAQFEKHVKYSTVPDLLLLLDTFLNSDKLLPLVPKCKFLLTTVLTLIGQMEHFHCDGTPSSSSGLTPDAADRWKAFLGELSKAVTSVGVVGPQKVLLKLDADCKIVQTLREHFQRHPTLNLELKLLALVSVGGKK